MAFTRDPRVDLRALANATERAGDRTGGGVEIDPERAGAQHLSPEIAQQPMLGQAVHWPLWALVAAILAVAIFIAWAVLGGTMPVY